MERKLIKADGTIYADFRGRPVRIVETVQLWDRGLGRYGSAPYAKPSTFGKMSGSSRPVGYGNSKYTGFLTVVSSNTPEAMADLADLEIPKTGDGVWLEAWKQSLPETLTVEILVSREITQTWDDYLEQRAVERAQRVAREVRSQARKDVVTRALERIVDAGLTTAVEDYRHTAQYPASPPRVSIAVADLEAFLDRLTQNTDTTGETRS